MNFEDCDNTELVNEYQNLSKICQEQKNKIDQYKQQIYTLNNEKNLKDNLLQDELQHIKGNFDSELDEVNRKNATEIKHLQNRLTAANLTLGKLELENEQLKNELDAAGNHSEVKNAAPSHVCNENEMIVSKKRIEFLEKNEMDYVELNANVAQLISEKSKLSSDILRLKVNIILYLFEI